MATVTAEATSTAQDIFQKLASATQRFSYPLQPGPYHEIDEDASIRIDFQNEIQTGINFKATKEHFSNRFSISGGTDPLFFKSSFFNKSFQNHNGEVSLLVSDKNKKIEINYDILPNGGGSSILGGILGKSGEYSGNIFLSSPLMGIPTVKLMDVVGSLHYKSTRSNLELKASKLDIGDLKHGVAGLSYCYSLRSWLALGFELYYKFGQNSGGGSLGGRCRGDIFGLQYNITTTYNIMGDLSVSSSMGIIPKFLSFSARYNLNTSSMASSIQVGTRVNVKPHINGYKIPICLKLRTDNNFEHAISLDMDTPFVCIGVGCFGRKQNLFKNYGVNFSI